MSAKSFAAIIGLFLVFAVCLGESRVTGTQEVSVGPPLVDRNENGISDGLEAVLDTVLPHERFAVVATFTGPPDVAFLHRAVGNFPLKRQFNIIHGFAADMTAAQIRGLSRTPGVFRIEEDFQVMAISDAANHDFGTELARATYGVNGNGVGVCIVDTGVDPTHEQTDGLSIVFSDFVNGRSAAYDDHGHGTHVTSICCGDGVGGSNASKFQGVAPAANVYAAKVLDLNGGGTESQVIAGIDWCATQQGVHIISMSLGSGSASDGLDAMSQAANKAVEEYGKVVVVAAGNSGDALETVGSPGAAASVITVGAAADWSALPTAANHSDGVYVVFFSSRGPNLRGVTKPDVVAPGYSITAAQAGTTSGYVTWSGTSMATPFVAGAVALALQADSNLTPAEVKGLVESTAQDRGPAGKDNDWGSGLLDGYALVSAASGSSGATAFPTYRRINGSVNNNGLWRYQFTLGAGDLNVPIGVLVTLDGELTAGDPLVCYYFPMFCNSEWAPDLDARLLDPKGNELELSGCAGIGDECSTGRTETLSVMPTVAGTYTIEVWPFDGEPNNGQGGSFLVDLSTGPVTEGSVPPPTPPPPPDPEIGVSSLTISKCVLTGKGKHQVTTCSTLLESTSSLSAGDTVEFQVVVVDDSVLAQPVSGATVTLAITGPSSTTLTTGLTGADGVATATWKTQAPNKRGIGGTPTGEYWVTVTGVSKAGYAWDGAQPPEPQRTFTLQ